MILFNTNQNIKLSPASKASREIANLTERKICISNPLYGVKEFKLCFRLN